MTAFVFAAAVVLLAFACASAELSGEHAGEPKATGFRAIGMICGGLALLLAFYAGSL